MFKPKGLNHITIRVNRIEDSKYFYGEVLGLELIKTMGQSMAFGLLVATVLSLFVVPSSYRLIKGWELELKARRSHG